MDEEDLCAIYPRPVQAYLLGAYMIICIYKINLNLFQLLFSFLYVENDSLTSFSLVLIFF